MSLDLPLDSCPHVFGLTICRNAARVQLGRDTDPEAFTDLSRLMRSLDLPAYVAASRPIVTFTAEVDAVTLLVPLPFSHIDRRK